MVYIDKDVHVLEKRPFNMARIMGIFLGLWLMIVHFFQTLAAPFTPERRSGDRRGGGSGGSGGGGRGFGGGGSGGGGDGFGPNRRIGRITNSLDHNVPGSCPGGGCGS